MSKDKGAPAPNVTTLPTTCCVEKCGKKGDRLNFCTEHFTWFKEGLVNKQGKKPVDFDKKYQAYLLRTKNAA
jgi:hypothetical protein